MPESSAAAPRPRASRWATTTIRRLDVPGRCARTVWSGTLPSIVSPSKVWTRGDANPLARQPRGDEPRERPVASLPGATVGKALCQRVQVGGGGEAGGPRRAGPPGGAGRGGAGGGRPPRATPTPPTHPGGARRRGGAAAQTPRGAS